jgi:hypothetical protein
MKSPGHLHGVISVLALAVLMTACAAVQAPLPPSLELPRPPNDLRAVRKGDRVYLFWTTPTRTIDHQSVRRPGPTRICRSLEIAMNSCGTPVGNQAPIARTEGEKKGMPAVKPEATFVDTLPRDLQQQNPTRLVSYAVEALNLEARSAGLSNRVLVALAPTLPPPGSFRAEVTKDGVMLTWDGNQPPPSAPDISYVCRISRKSVDAGTDAKLVDADCSAGRFQDASIAWQKTYEYRITSVTTAKLEKGAMPCPTQKTGEGVTSFPDCITVVEVEGDDSSPQRVFTKDIYPPAVPTGLQAVYSGPGQQPFVDLLWAPDTDADLAGYNIYRREEGSTFAKINSDVVKTPAYRDGNILPGKTYSYTVTAVDERGNESARSEEASETVPQEP